MRALSYLLFVVLTLGVILLSVANRQLVRVNLAPDFTDYGMPPSLGHEVPLFVIALGFGTFGFVIGAAREYLREARLRRESKAQKRQIAALRRELAALKGTDRKDEDEDLLLLASR
jgi:hypothetical protein